jgi:hypothetical protein
MKRDVPIAETPNKPSSSVYQSTILACVPISVILTGDSASAPSRIRQTPKPESLLAQSRIIVR